MTRPPLLPWIPWLLLAASCSSPPKPPTVDESRKRPANTAAAVELHSCRSELENARIVVSKNARSTEASGQAMARLSAQHQLLVQSTRSGSSAPQRNLLATLLFDFGSTRVSVPESEATRILDEARMAPLVVLRGRTDGTAESPAESAIARQRASAVEAWLVQSGVDRARVRTTWQPVGDHAADNAIPGGRALNRRVEIEIYRAAPVVLAAVAIGAANGQQR